MSLRSQLEAMSADLSSAGAEVRRLEGALSLREQELSRHVKLAHSAAMTNTGTVSTAYTTEGTAVNIVAADIANKRIIDQLNGQVDFLNEQLAHREAQIVHSADKVRQFDQLSLELAHRGELVEQLRAESAHLSAQLRAADQKASDCSSHLISFTDTLRHMSSPLFESSLLFTLYSLPSVLTAAASIKR